MIEDLEILEAIKIDDLIFQALEANSQKAIDLLNEQLDAGIDEAGWQIRTYAANTPNVYAYYTITVKSSKRQPTNRVTLKDTGVFRETFSVHPEADGFYFDYNEKKEDGDISDNVDLNAAIGLTNESCAELAEVLADYMAEEIVNLL
jgi:hypothetical protein